MKKKDQDYRLIWPVDLHTKVTKLCEKLSQELDRPVSIKSFIVQAVKEHMKKIGELNESSKNTK